MNVEENHKLNFDDHQEIKAACMKPPFPVRSDNNDKNKNNKFEKFKNAFFSHRTYFHFHYTPQQLHLGLS